MSSKVLIAGASGLVGTAAAHSFLNAGWQVTAACRRKPDLIEHPNCQWLALDLHDAAACQQAARELADISHLVYTAVYEMPGLIPGWSDPKQIETNDRMFRNLLNPFADQLEHVTLLQGTKAYGGAVQPMRIPARESQPRVEHPNFYWLQEDHLRSKAALLDITILRPQLIVGPNIGVVMNLPPVIGAYAAIRHALGLPFSYPGGVDWVWEAADARLVGDACLWAATHPAAGGETFNLTNGEVFSFRDMWPALAEVLNMPLGPDEPLSMAEYLPQYADLWADIVQEFDLQPNTLDDLLGQSHHYADLCFASGAQQAPLPVFVSTVKIRQAGFATAFNTEASFCHWLNDLIERRIIPQLP